MKKLKLISLQKHNSLQKEDLQRIKGGTCQPWTCQCILHPEDGQKIDDELERQDREGYI